MLATVLTFSADHAAWLNGLAVIAPLSAVYWFCVA